MDQEIKKLLDDCQKLGNEGKLDNVVVLMEEVEKIKKRKEDTIKLYENPNTISAKHMKVCEICGAMQTVTNFYIIKLH